MLNRVVDFVPDQASTIPYLDLMIEMTRYEFPDSRLPTLEGVSARLQNSLKAAQPTAYYAIWDGPALAGVLLATFPDAERAGVIEVDVRVDPARRRSGLGTTMNQ